MGTEFRLARVNERFFVVWYDDAGRRQRRSLGTDDHATGQARLGEFIRQISFQQAAGENLTVGAVYDAYVKDREMDGKAAVPRMRDAWKRLNSTFGTLLPIQVNKDLCRSYMAKRRQAGVSNGTIHVELGYLRAAMRFARTGGWITQEPVVVLPRKPPPKEHHLTPDEARRLIAAAELPHVKLFIILALFTAGRSSAILDLTWDRVDTECRIIRLRDPVVGETSKGRATVPISDTAYAALEEAKKGAVSNYVIEWGGKQVASVKKGVAAAARRSGVTCTPHVLRHTAAVWMAGADVSMTRIAQYLGHRDSRTTERVYARFSPSYLKDAALALETQFSLVDPLAATANVTGTEVVRTLNARTGNAGK